MANPTTFTTRTAIVVANHLYNIQLRITLAGHPYPLPPSADTCDVLHCNEHYSTLRYNNPWGYNRTLRGKTLVCAYLLSLHNTYPRLKLTAVLGGNAWHELVYCSKQRVVFRSCRPLLFLSSNTPTHGSRFRQEQIYVCYLLLPFRLGTAPGFHVPHIPKENLVCIYTFACHFFVLESIFFLFVRALFGKTPSTQAREARLVTLVEVSARSVHSGARGGRSQFFFRLGWRRRSPWFSAREALLLI